MSTFIEICIALTPPTILAVLTYLQSLKNGDDIRTIHVQLNSRLDSLLAEVKEGAWNAGIKFERDRNTDVAPPASHPDKMNI